MDLLAEKVKVILFPNQKVKHSSIDHHMVLQTISDALWKKIPFKNFIDSYLMKNSEELFSNDSFSRDHYSFLSPFVSFQEYIKVFVDVNTTQPDSITDELRIFFFKLIYLYIAKERTYFIQNSTKIENKDKDKEIAKAI